MPTPRQYPDRAARQKAYRERHAQAVAAALSAKGLPPLPPLPTMPGTARWSALIGQAKTLLETAKEEMETYQGERSEAWQDTERGQLMAERVEVLDSIIAALEDAV